MPPASQPAPGADWGLFERGSVARRVNGEAVLLLAGPRTLLLQIAHPAVAHAVARHSDFPRAAWSRLRRTLDVMFRLTYGDARQAAETAERLTDVHSRVTGPGYRALDEHLLLWVWATLVDGALTAHRLFVGDLDPEEADAYVDQMGAIAVASGVRPGTAPATAAAFERYLAGVAPELRVGAEARALAPSIVSPPLPLLLIGARAFARLLTLGMLPDDLRRAYRLPWSAAHRRAFDAAVGAVRLARRATPDRLRRVPPGFVLRSSAKSG